VLLWPWQDLRFAVPLMPFLFYYLAHALTLPIMLVARLKPVDARTVAGVALIALSVPACVHTVHIAQADRAAGYHYQADKLGDWEGYSDWQDFHAAAMWLQAHAVPGATVVNRSPNIFYLWTGLASRNYPYSLSPATVMQDVSMEHNDYVVYDDFTWTYTTPLYLRPAIKLYPDRFIPVAHFHGTTVYRVVPPKAKGR
jgi:hypothetical protein